MLFDSRLGRLRAMLGMRLVLSQARQMGPEVAGRDVVDDLYRVAGRHDVGVMEVGRQYHQDQGEENRMAHPPTGESRRRSPDARSGRGRQGFGAAAGDPPAAASAPPAASRSPSPTFSIPAALIAAIVLDHRAVRHLPHRRARKTSPIGPRDRDRLELLGQLVETPSLSVIEVDFPGCG